MHPPFKLLLFVEVGKHNFFQESLKFYLKFLADQILLLFETADFLHDGIF